jgi:hypothetical protein
MKPRKTVTIKMPGEISTRSFHLHEAKAERFAEKVRSEGGEAFIGPLAIGDDTALLLGRLGIAPLSFKSALSTAPPSIIGRSLVVVTIVAR